MNEYTYEVGRYVVYLMNREPMYNKWQTEQRAYFSTEEEAVSFVKANMHKYAGWKLKKEMYMVDHL